MILFSLLFKAMFETVFGRSKVKVRVLLGCCSGRGKSWCLGAGGGNGCGKQWVGPSTICRYSQWNLLMNWMSGQWYKREGRMRLTSLSGVSVNWVVYVQEEKEMATHSSILVWRIPWMEEPGRLQSMGSQREWLTTLLFTLCTGMEIAVWSRISGGEIKDYVLDMLVLRVLLNMLISHLDTLAWRSAKWVAYICKFDINHLHANISPWGFPGGSVVKNQPAKQAM